MIRLEIPTRAVLLVLGAVVLFRAAERLLPIAIMLIVSLMLAAALLPYVEYLIRGGLNRGLAVLVVMLWILFGVLLIGILVVPVVVDQGRALVDRLPELRRHAVTLLDERGADQFARQVEQFNPQHLVEPGKVAGAGRRAFGVLTMIFTILVLTAYILFDARRIERFVYFATPAAYHDHVRNLLVALQRVVGGYIRGQVVTSAAIMTFTLVLLLALRIPNAMALAVLAAIADMVPMIGVVLVVAPSTAAAYSVSLPKAIIVAGALLAYQEFENRILVQRVYGATLRLPAVVVLLALLIGAELFGVAGALLSLPAAAAIRTFVEYGNEVRKGNIPRVAPAEQPLAPDIDEGMTADPLQTSGSRVRHLPVQTED